MRKIQINGKTDVGLFRAKNEDVFVINRRAGFCLVADGMGGAAAGETASRIFAQTAEDVFSQRIPANEQEAVENVQSAFKQANDRILAHVAEHPADEGMGCTAELLVFSGNGFVIGHMGDSRTYRYRQGVFKQLTKDHSLVQNQIDQGMITREQARTHSMRNVILRAVGVGPSPSLDLLRGPVHAGDVFLLCSDGLTDMVDDRQIVETLARRDDLDIKTGRLIHQAKESGGKDNITVVLAQID